MAAVPLCTRPDYGLCPFSHTILISFGYSQRLCFLTSYILWLATCDRCILVPICLMQNCKKIYPCSSHQYAKTSRVTSQHENHQKYKRRVLGIIPCKCRPAWEAVCRNACQLQLSTAWGNTVQCHHSLNIASAFHVGVYLVWIPIECKTEWRSRWICHLLLTSVSHYQKTWN